MQICNIQIQCTNVIQVEYRDKKNKKIQNMKCLCWARKAPFWNALSPLFVFH